MRISDHARVSSSILDMGIFALPDNAIQTILDHIVLSYSFSK